MDGGGKEKKSTRKKCPERGKDIKRESGKEIVYVDKMNFKTHIQRF